MDDLNAETVTQAALQQMAATPDPRLRAVMASLVRHLHDFAREVTLTPEEWLTAIRFLTEVGHACSPVRQEFILLSDVLGLSALVNAQHVADAAPGGTEASLLGPFFRADAPVLAAGTQIARDPGAPELLLHGRVTDTAGAPIAGARIDVWQTSATGLYDLQIAGAAMDLRGAFQTDAEGRFHFRTVQPLGYQIPMDGPVGRLARAQGRHGYRPAHIHFLIGAAGYQELVTALYFAEDPHIDSDMVFGVAKALVVSPVAEDPAAPIQGMASLRYDFALARAEGNASHRVGADPASLQPA